MAFSKGFKVLAAIAILGGIGFLAAIFWGELNKDSASTTSDMTVPTTVPTIVQSCKKKSINVVC
jgi:Na+/H+ antiporter NhaA